MDAMTLWVTLKLAVATTFTLALFGIPAAFWMATTRFRGKFLVEAVVTLPLILPPTVLGFYLLVGLGPRTIVGQAYETCFGSPLIFSFVGIWVGSVLCNLPLAMRSFISAISAVPSRLLEASICLGESKWSTLRRVVIPLSWPGILAGLALTFAHSIGEFGVVLMIGGNIPQVTRTLSIAIYDDVQMLDYAAANRSAMVLVLFAFLILCFVQWFSSPRGSTR